MKSFSLIYQYEDINYLTHFDGTFYFEIYAPSGNFFIKLTEENTKNVIETEIPFETEDHIILTILSEETNFYNNAFEFIIDRTNQFFIDFFESNTKILDLRDLIYLLGDGLTEIAEKSYIDFRGDNKVAIPENIQNG